MAEDSAFWDGSSTGDAASSDVWQAPYSSEEFVNLVSKLLLSHEAQGFVIPGYNNNLRVFASTPAAMTIEVASGALAVRGRVYENTAQRQLTIATADATNPRLDRIVARIGFAGQTIRLAVLSGTAAATPTLPALTQSATTFEIELAYVYVQAAAATITDADIHDVREFMPTTRQLLDYDPVTNFIRNSEFMAFSALNNITTTNPPDQWALVATPSDIASVAKPSQMMRGRGIQITADASNEGISQTMQVKASQTYAFKVLVNVTAGDVGSIVVTTNSAAPGTITRNIRRTGAWIEEWIYYTTESDASTLTISLRANSATDVVAFGQVLVIEGFIAGPFRPIHEIIFFDKDLISDTNWDGDLKSDGTTTITLSADFKGLILDGTLALYMQVFARDSGSAGCSNCGLVATAVGFSVSGGRAAVSGHANNAEDNGVGWAEINASRQINIVVEASGVNTLTAFVYIVGIQI